MGRAAWFSGSEQAFTWALRAVLRSLWTLFEPREMDPWARLGAVRGRAEEPFPAPLVPPSDDDFEPDGLPDGVCCAERLVRPVHVLEEVHRLLAISHLDLLHHR